VSADREMRSLAEGSRGVPRRSTTEVQHIGTELMAVCKDRKGFACVYAKSIDSSFPSHPKLYRGSRNIIRMPLSGLHPKFLERDLYKSMDHKLLYHVEQVFSSGNFSEHRMDQVLSFPGMS